ncbi:hypothetical protein LCGC14_1721990, partial [marine sediment metagenome]
LYIASTSSEFLLGHSSTILKKDIEGLPWPENEEDLELSKVENIHFKIPFNEPK